MSAEPMKPIRNSFTDTILGPLLIKQATDPRFIGRITSRIIVLALPFFHLADSLASLGCYARSSLQRKKWIVEPQGEREGIPTSFYLTLAKVHAKAIFTSIIVGMKSPESQIHGYEYAPQLPKTGITYDLMPLSRLGDNLGCYFTARWLAYKHNIPFIVKEFPHMDELSIISDHEYVLPLESRFSRRFTSFENVEQFNQPGIYSVPFLADVKIDWEDSKFREILLKELAHSTTVNLVLPQAGKFNIALHVRTGGSFDHSNARLCFPLKVPPRDFYVEAITHALNTYKGLPIHIQIFTDSLNPQEEVQQFQELVNKISVGVTVEYKKPLEGDSESMTIPDMLSMSKYDCLIRAQSGLSIMSEKIGQPRYVLLLKDVKFENGEPLTKIFSEIAREKDEKGAVLKTNYKDIEITGT